MPCIIMQSLRVAAKLKPKAKLVDVATRRLSCLSYVLV